MKKRDLAALFMLITTITYSQSGCKCGDCENGTGNYSWKTSEQSSGDEYMGEWSGGNRTGYGIYDFSSGSFYGGQYDNNLPYGYGYYRFTNGDSYFGQWIDNKRTGFGCYVYASGIKNIGSFSEDVYNENSSASSNGCVSGNCTDGNGIYIFSSGEQYNGDWKNYKRNGVGINIFTDGIIYRGDWVDDIRSGIGRQLYNESSEFFMFLGSFSNDKPYLGRMYYKDGKNFLGGFVNGLPDGSGTMTYCDGSELSGYWKDGVYAGSTADDYDSADDYDYSSDVSETSPDNKEYTWTAYNMKFEIPKDLTVTQSDIETFIASNDKVNFSIYAKTVNYTSDYDLNNEVNRWAKENNVSILKEAYLLDEDHSDYKRYMATGTIGEFLIGCILIIDQAKKSQGFYIWLSADLDLVNSNANYIGFIDSFEKINKETIAPVAPKAPVKP